MAGGSGTMQQYRMALVTGATSGIGTAFAEALPPETGLLLTGRDRAALDALAATLAAEGRTVETHVADLAVETDRVELLAWAEALGVDLLINNAGLGVFGPVIGNALDREMEMVAVNVTAVVHLTRALLPGMTARAHADGGRAGLIIVSSVVAFTPMPMLATYAATKTFELSFGEALADEMKDAPVDVLVLCPGATRTKFFDRAGMPKAPGYSEMPEPVARKALRALGRKRVLVSQPPARTALLLATARRRVMVAGAGFVMRRIAGREGE